MSIFAVTYHYAASAEALAEVRPIHREWTAAQFEAGTLISSGPFVDYSGALLLFRADSATELSALLDNDPFDIAGFIGERVILQWNPLYGPLKELA
ncbi:MAG: hypothetical protein RLZ28_20 [Actinomycetota bacterium]